jgi:hypothetical protein
VNSLKTILMSSIAAIAFAAAACGGGGSNPPTPPPISVVLSTAPPASITVGQAASVAATVSNDSSNSGVNWSVTCGASECGRFNPGTTAGGAATTYTAPANVPTGGSVTIVATSVADGTATASASVTIVGPALADGTYIYNGSGQDVNGVLYYAGAFTVLNGAVTGGEHDYLDQANIGTDTISPTGSSITTQPEGTVEIILNTNDANFGDNGVFTLRGVSVSATRMQLTEFDNFATATGTLDVQTGKAAPAGGYAFQISGLDGDTNGPNPLGIGGVLTINGTAIDTANSIFDYNDGGSIAQGAQFASGTVSAPDALGRIQISLTPDNSSGAKQFGMIGYIIGPDRIQFVETGGDGINGTMGGTAFGQGANTGTFTAGNVAGSVYVFTAVGDDGNGMTIAAGLQLNAGGTVQGNVTFSDLNTNGSENVTGQWTVDSLGRVTVTNINPTPTGTPLAFQFYIDGFGNGVELGIDTSQVSASTAYQQTSGSINPGDYALGAFGFFLDGTVANQLDPWSAAGPLTIAGAALDGFTDYNASGTLTEGATLTGTVDTTNGVVDIGGLDVNNTTPDSYGYYPVDGSRTLLIEFDGNQLGIAFLEGLVP